MPFGEQRIVLQGDTALEKFLPGRDTWNAYVDEHPEADVNFEAVDFSAHRQDGEAFDFSGYRFPRGYVDFSKAQFGEGDVDFSKAQFGEGDVDFREAQFGEGDVDFRDARFRKGKVKFGGVLFGKGSVGFSLAEFGAGGVFFSQAQFGEGNVDFMGAEFGEGDVDFRYAQFGAGNVDFMGVLFGEGDVDFREVQFGAGDVDFRDAQFGAGDVYFSQAQFGAGTVYFMGAQFGEGVVSFETVEFMGHLSISNLDSPHNIKQLTFRHCTFGKTFDISGNDFNCIPDLTNTKLTNQMSLDRLKCSAKLDEQGQPNPLDAEKLCRLKEIAESNKNHDQALLFHIQEMRVKRHTQNKAYQLIDWVFDALSEYGRSIIKPAIWLITFTAFFASVYAVISVVFNEVASGFESIGNGLLYSAAQVLPFVSSGRATATESATRLFTNSTVAFDIPNWLYAISLTQGIISFVLLFLIGLGLRNRFRL